MWKEKGRAQKDALIQMAALILVSWYSAPASRQQSPAHRWVMLLPVVILSVLMLSGQQFARPREEEMTSSALN